MYKSPQLTHRNVVAARETPPVRSSALNSSVSRARRRRASRYRVARRVRRRDRTWIRHSESPPFEVRIGQIDFVSKKYLFAASTARDSARRPPPPRRTTTASAREDDDDIARDVRQRQRDARDARRATTHARWAWTIDITMRFGWFRFRTRAQGDARGALRGVERGDEWEEFAQSARGWGRDRGVDYRGGVSHEGHGCAGV